MYEFARALSQPEHEKTSTQQASVMILLSTEAKCKDINVVT
jgi:hypothetical protein